MKNLLLFASILLSWGELLAQDQTLTVIVREVKNSKGFVRVAIYTTEKDFMKVKWRSAFAPAKTGEVHVVFDNVPPGTYALSVVHDANGNDQMDTNAVGIPKEGFGFSNNALGLMGPPGYNEVKWIWDGSEKPSITLKYD